jgi:microcystin-dependent protein
MPLESASFISQLNIANPASTDTVSQADDHLRLIKNVLKTTFPNIDSPVTSTPAQLNSPVPVGLIAMWSGAINAVPSGWRLCDGTNSTPDLRDRFIVGAGSTYAVGNTGGSATVTLNESQIPGHTHVISATTSSAGAHTHTATGGGHTHFLVSSSGPNSVLTGSNYLSFSANVSSGLLENENFEYQLRGTPAEATTGLTGGSGAHSHTTDSQGAHTHAVSASASTTGGGQAHENRPPYFALAYIMKV